MRRTIISLRRRSIWRNSATLVLLGLVSMPGGASLQAARSAVQLRVPVGASPNVRWAVEKLKTQLRSAGYNLDANSGAAIEVVPGATDLPVPARKPEGFWLLAAADGVRIAGFDDAGAMYGVLDLAKRVRDAGRLPENVDFSDAPAMTLRGTCVFLMKLGTYDYPVTPQEFPFFYDKPLWVQYLDFLAENRFNYIAFWNGHPFDYFVSLDRFPEAQAGMEPGLLQSNHDMLMWIANEAQRRHIWLMFQFYNIHTSVYFQKAHGLPAWNSKPTPLLT